MPGGLDGLLTAAFPVPGGTNVATGAAGRTGTATLAAGTATVATTAVAAGSKIFLTYSGTPSAPGTLSVGTITAGVSFVINSSSGTDASAVNWLVIN